MEKTPVRLDDVDENRVVTGFGETGPNTERPAFDQVVQGMGGGMHITGDPESAPVRSGPHAKTPAGRARPSPQRSGKG